MMSVVDVLLGGKDNGSLELDFLEEVIVVVDYWVCQEYRFIPKLGSLLVNQYYELLTIIIILRSCVI